jgi:hypothetical protein
VLILKAKFFALGDAFFSSLYTFVFQSLVILATVSIILIEQAINLPVDSIRWAIWH